MLILILIDSQKGAFNFEKGSNRQNYSSPGSLHLVKKIPPLPQKNFCPHQGGEDLPPPPPPPTPYCYLENPDITGGLFPVFLAGSFFLRSFLLIILHS